MRRSRVATRLVQAVLVGTVAAAALGCDPCTGMAQCGGPYLAAAGQIVDPDGGAGIDGVRVDVVRTGGIGVDVDSVSAVTTRGGFWHVALSPHETGTLVADVQVSAPGVPSYRMHEVQLTTRAHAGDSNGNERWAPYLYFNHFGEFYLRGTTDQRVVGASVEFRRTGGLTTYGPGLATNVYRATTDVAGHVSLFPRTGAQAVFARESGSLVGDLVVVLADGSTTTFRGVELSPVNRYGDPRDYPPIYRNVVGP
jgi:hypothetical protein